MLRHLINRIARHSTLFKEAQRSVDFWQSLYNGERNDHLMLIFASAEFIRANAVSEPTMQTQVIKIIEHTKVEHHGAVDYFATATFPDGTSETGICRHLPTRNMALCDLFAKIIKKFCSSDGSLQVYTIRTTEAVWDNELKDFRNVDVTVK